jgi:putative transposase
MTTTLTASGPKVGGPLPDVQRRSKRKACQFVGITFGVLDLPFQDKGDERLKESILAIWRPKTGYRMLHSLLLKVFPGINIKRTYRLWTDLRLGRVKRYRKKRTGTPVPYAATMPNDVWTMDIIHDSCMNGTKLWILSVVDEFARECLALEVSTHINSSTVRSVLCRLFTTRAVPRFLRRDNGGEFIARSTAMLLHEAKCTARVIQPGKPWQNGFIESIHSTLRRDHLDVEVFFNRLDAQLKKGIYRYYYNQLPPHSALGYKAPTEYATMKVGSLM